MHLRDRPDDATTLMDYWVPGVTVYGVPANWLSNALVMEAGNGTDQRCTGDPLPGMEDNENEGITDGKYVLTGLIVFHRPLIFPIWFSHRQSRLRRPIPSSIPRGSPR